MLLALLSGQRRHTIYKLNLHDIRLDDNRCLFYINSLLKQSRKGRLLAPIELLTYPSSTKLYIVYSDSIERVPPQDKGYTDGAEAAPSQLSETSSPYQ